MGNLGQGSDFGRTVSRSVATVRSGDHFRNILHQRGDQYHQARAEAFDPDSNSDYPPRYLLGQLGPVFGAQVFRFLTFAPNDHAVIFSESLALAEIQASFGRVRPKDTV